MLFGHQVLMEYVYYYVLKIKTEASNVEKKDMRRSWTIRAIYQILYKFPLQTDIF